MRNGEKAELAEGCGERPENCVKLNAAAHSGHQLCSSVVQSGQRERRDPC